MAKASTRQRFDTPARDPGRYHREMLAHRADPDNVEAPPSEEVEVVETWAVHGGEKVKVRVYADQVAAYEEVLAEWEAAGQEEGSR